MGISSSQMMQQLNYKIVEEKLTWHLLYAELRNITLYGVFASEEVMLALLDQQRNSLTALRIERDRIHGGGSCKHREHDRDVSTTSEHQHSGAGGEQGLRIQCSYLAFSTPLANPHLQSGSFGRTPESYYCPITGLQRLAGLSYQSSLKAVTGVDYGASDMTDMDQMMMLLK